MDEFLFIRDGKTVCDEFSRYADVDSLFVNWRLFGDSNISSVSDGNYSVLKRFTMCDSKLNRLGKHIINLKRVGNSAKFFNPHILQYSKPPLREFKSIDPNGTRYCEGGNVQNNNESERMELYHYRNKTWEENVKRKFGTDDAFHEADDCDFRRDMNAVKREFDSHNKNEILNTNIANVI